MTIWTAFVGQTWSFAPAQMIQLLKFGILRGAKKSVHCPVMCFEDSKEWRIYIFIKVTHAPTGFWTKYRTLHPILLISWFAVIP